jgi:hypothetical protein
MKSHLARALVLCSLVFLLIGCIPAPTITPPTATTTITPTATITPSPTQTITPSPIPTPTRILPEDPWIMLYDFDNTDIDPIFQQQIPQNCSLDQKNGILNIECKSDTQNDTYLRYIPRTTEKLRGVAMLAHVDAPYNETWGRINPMVHFAQPGNSDTREYTMSLRKGIVKVTEYYPAKGFTFTVLGGRPIPVDQQNDFHLLQIEFIDGSLQFILDGDPIVLDVQPDLPQGYIWESWKFELVLFKRSEDTKTLVAQVDWFAILK